MKKEQTVIKFDNIKDLLYHSANTYADNIAFTTSPLISLISFSLNTFTSIYN